MDTVDPPTAPPLSTPPPSAGLRAAEKGPPQGSPAKDTTDQERSWSDPLIRRNRWKISGNLGKMIHWSGICMGKYGKIIHWSEKTNGKIWKKTSIDLDNSLISGAKWMNHSPTWDVGTSSTSMLQWRKQKWSSWNTFQNWNEWKWEWQMTEIEVIHTSELGFKAKQLHTFSVSPTNVGKKKNKCATAARLRSKSNN